ncbi:hypothetical protein ACPA9J_18070 [Pseudomonas aeruginosa]
MRPPLSQVVVLVSHLQRPRQPQSPRQPGGRPGGGLPGRPYRGARHLGIRSPANRSAISNSAARPTCSSVLAPLPPTCVDTLARPVLTMRVGGGDLLRALEQAREHSSHVALLSCYNRIGPGPASCERCSRCRSSPGRLHHPEEARQAVLEVARLLPQHHRFVDGGGAGGTGRPARRAVAERRHRARRSAEPWESSIASAWRRQAAASGRGAATHSKRCGSGRQPGCGAIAQPCPAQLLELPVSSALGRPLQQLCPELDLQQALEDGGGEETG